MSDEIKKDEKKEELDDCVKPNNPEAQRMEDEDDACREPVDGN